MIHSWIGKDNRIHLDDPQGAVLSVPRSNRRFKVDTSGRT